MMKDTQPHHLGGFDQKGGENNLHNQNKKQKNVNTNHNGSSKALNNQAQKKKTITCSNSASKHDKIPEK